MIVYFVRHGESEGNALGQHQSFETGLSEIGRSQAAFASLRFKKIPIDVILASNLTRTIQTAEIINSSIQKQIIPTPLLREIHRPTEVLGRKIDDVIDIEIQRMIHDHRNYADWHYSDEENFYDFRLRARECLRMIEGREESKILCVTHGIMLVMMLSVIIFGDELTPDLFGKMTHQFHAQNTGITICKYDDHGWRLITWNDHAHLG
jgi:probable phosphoglycerate mutase